MVFVSKMEVDFNNFFEQRQQRYKNFPKHLLQTYQDVETNRVIDTFPEPLGLRIDSMTANIERQLWHDLEDQTSSETCVSIIQSMEQAKTISDSCNSVLNWISDFLTVKDEKGEPILFDNLLGAKGVPHNPMLLKIVRQRLFDIYFGETEKAYKSFATTGFRLDYPHIWYSSENLYYNLRLFIRVLNILEILEDIKLFCEEQIWSLRYSSCFEVFRDWYESLCLSIPPASPDRYSLIIISSLFASLVYNRVGFIS